MLDQRLARAVAGLASGSPPANPYVPVDLEEVCLDAQARIEAHTGLVCPRPVPTPEAVDRREWAAQALGDMASMVDPVAGRSGLPPVLRSAFGAALSTEAGALTGYLSQRVLGQYAVVLSSRPTPPRPARLLFVAPNIAEATVRLGARPDQLWTWIAVHEVTHAVQFAAVPWLRGHLGGMLEDLLTHLDAGVDLRRLMRVPRPDVVRAAAGAVRRDGLTGALRMVDDGRAADLLDRLQTTMAVVEGHAEYVMDAVGADVVEDLTLLREAMDHRRASRPPLLRLLESVIGLETKLRQYADGRRFCDAAVAGAGVSGLHEVFRGPEALPTPSELDDPARWLERCGPGRADPSPL